MTTLRASAESDIPSITAIYAHYVTHSAATFELDAPSLEEMSRRRGEIAVRGLPHLVAESSGRILGYAYASPYRSRRAYRFAVEDSI